MNIDEIEEKHDADCAGMGHGLPDFLIREAALIAMVRQLEADLIEEVGEYYNQCEDALVAKEDAEAKIKQLEADNAGLVEAKTRYAKVFERIAIAHGVTSPYQLICRAKNNEDNYAEILAGLVEEALAKHGGKST